MRDNDGRGGLDACGPLSPLTVTRRYTAGADDGTMREKSRSAAFTRGESSHRCRRHTTVVSAVVADLSVRDYFIPW